METTKIPELRKRGRDSVRLLAFIKAKKGRGKDLLEVLLKLVEPTLDEKGSISYVPHVSVDNPDEILFDEIWLDEASIEEHIKKPYMVNLHAEIGNLVDGPIVLKKYREVFLDRQ